ncbi:MAG: branched-chain alpha-keto acid dehydrogenase subunit E2 [Methylococcales symbiont of Hymedesmia sp. n. MRB-2018]|nr:MAG: branched-chain alpha-keto acid dehydrogenase subunit E2 [Methylococcales symbiont of Hymedesmia sp. n. MRB-2018]
MSELTEIKIPDLGGADSVEIVEVLIKAGDTVEKEQTLAVMESDKATMDLPANEAGTIQKVLFKVGDKVSQGTLVAMLQAGANVATPAEKKSREATKIEKPVEAKPARVQTVPEVKASVVSNSQAHATPCVRLFARELGVDLSKITQGSGRKDRILKEDVQVYVKKAMSQGAVQVTGVGIPPIPKVDFSQFGETEVQALSKIKHLTGDHMVRVCLNVPMVTQHDEVDITEMEAFRQNTNSGKPEIKLTGLVFIIKALVTALQKFPQFNSSLSADGQSLIYKKYFNIGIAVETPNGLTVPVIHGADKMSLNQLSAALGDLSSKARNGKLPPSAMQGGCMTISSLGGIGGTTAFTPIVNAPEVAILGVSRSKMQPVWKATEFIPRLMLPLDLSYDHRVIDGAEAARFLVALTQYLGDIRRLLL